MGPLPYQPLFLTFLTKSGYLDSNGHYKTARVALHTPRRVHSAAHPLFSFCQKRRMSKP